MRHGDCRKVMWCRIYTQNSCRKVLWYIIYAQHSCRKVIWYSIYIQISCRNVMSCRIYTQEWCTLGELVLFELWVVSTRWIPLSPVPIVLKKDDSSEYSSVLHSIFMGFILHIPFNTHTQHIYFYKKPVYKKQGISTSKTQGWNLADPNKFSNWNKK